MCSLLLVTLHSTRWPGHPVEFVKQLCTHHYIELQRFWITDSTLKTKVMAFPGADPIRVKTAVDGTVLQQVSNLEYLYYNGLKIRLYEIPDQSYSTDRDEISQGTLSKTVEEIEINGKN